MYSYTMIKYNKTYKYTIQNVSFGNLSRAALIRIFKDGRYVSPLIEEHLTIWFPGLTRIEGNKDHDHVDKKGIIYDAKNFTKNGMMFMPSNQIGASRKYDPKITEQKANKLIYICCDVVDFPDVKVRFIPGKQLIKSYPKAKVPYGERDSFFGE